MTECCLIDCRGCPPDVYQAVLRLIPQHRREKAESYLHYGDKVMSACAGLCIEFIKRMYACGCFTDADGKPQLDDGIHHFNISHSAGMVLLAWSEHPIGVDIQSLVNDVSISRLVLSPSELAALSEPPNASALTDIWCRKEAYTKMLGTGLRADFRTLDIVALSETSEFVFSPVLVEGFGAYVCHGDDAMSISRMTLSSFLDGF